jgi:catechol 2,3-dioxygenase-like lactoylglutathione lyase family enzyme
VFDRLTLRASDAPASERFFVSVLGAIGIASPPDFAIEAADAEHPVTTGLHIGFVARSRSQVDEFWRAGVEAGYRDDGEPGPRPQYAPDYYGGFLLDPDGNSAEAVHFDGMREGGALVCLRGHSPAGYAGASPGVVIAWARLIVQASPPARIAAITIRIPTSSPVGLIAMSAMTRKSTT